MLVKDLIEKLQKAEPGAAVIAFDGDSQKMEEITGLIITDATVEICTDEL